MLFGWSVFLLVLSVVPAEATTTEATKSSKAWVWILVIVLVAAVIGGVVLLFLWKKGQLCGKGKTPSTKKTSMPQQATPTTTSALTEPTNGAGSKSTSAQNIEEKGQPMTKAEDKEKRQPKEEDKREHVMEQGTQEKKENAHRSNREEVDEKLGMVRDSGWQVTDEVDSELFSFDISSATEQ